MKNTSNLQIDIASFNEHREGWAKIAQKAGWYKEPFYIQVWVEHDGTVVDSVAYRDMDSNIAVSADSDMFLCAFDKPNPKTSKPDV